MSDNTCSFCSRKGVLIYPVRYAIACPAGAAGIPDLSSNFKVVGAPQQIGAAKYALRAIRPGYLYTYDERRRLLKAYMVMPMGHLWNFPIEYLPPAPRDVPFHCIDPGEIVLAHCVDIAHSQSDPATNLWIGWSSVVWTKALIKKAGEAVWRKKHMQCINVPAMLTGSAIHAGEFATHYKKIAHFGTEDTAMRKAFSFSNISISNEIGRQRWGELMDKIMAAQSPHKNGFIVALNDPVGVTNDLSELLVPGLDSGFDEDIYRGKIVADLLHATEQKIKEQAREDVARNDEVAEANRDNPDGDTYRASGSLWKVIKAGGPSNYRKKIEQDKKKYGVALAGRQTAAATHAWDELIQDDNGKPILDSIRLEQFQKLYDAAIKKFTPSYNRLADAHADWLRSEQLANWMDGVHDPSDIRTGYAYSESFAQCIGKAASSQPCVTQLNAWLNSGKVSDIRNLYARALLFNQDDLTNAAESHLKSGDIQAENILNIYKGALDRLEKREAARLLDRLALATANILIGALKKSASKTMRGMAVIHLSMLAGSVVKANNLSAHEFSKWILAQARNENINLSTSNRKTKADAYKQAKAVIRNNAGKSDIVAYQLDMDKLARDGRIKADSIKVVKIPGMDMTRQWLGSSAPIEFHLGVVTAIIQLVALNFAYQDLADNDRFNETETRIKALIAVISLGSTIVDTVASTIAKSTIHPLATYIHAQWAISTNCALKIAKGGQIIGAAAGIVAGLYDMLINTSKSYSDGNPTLAFLYFANGAMGISIAVAAYFSAAAIFWPALILSFVAGILIAVFNNGALQQWISHCYFSMNFTNKETEKHYQTLDEELKAYHSASGA